jgi:hypothetical protein
MDNATVSATITKAPLEKVGQIEKDGQVFPIYRHTITKGLGKDNQFLGLDFDNLSWDTLVSLVGEENALDFLRREFRRYSNLLFKGTVDVAESQGVEGDPEAVLNLYKGFLVEMSVQGESKSDLEARQKELIGEITKLAVEATKNPSLMPKFVEMSSRLQKLSEAIEAKSRKKTEPVAEPVAA